MYLHILHVLSPCFNQRRSRRSFTPPIMWSFVIQRHKGGGNGIMKGPDESKMTCFYQCPKWVCSSKTPVEVGGRWQVPKSSSWDLLGYLKALSRSMQRGHDLTLARQSKGGSMAAMDNTTMYEDDYAGCSTKDSWACLLWRCCCTLWCLVKGFKFQIWSNHLKF